MMDLLPEFDKNAAFIWACYGLGLIIIGGTLIISLLRARSARKVLERQLALSEEQDGADA